jgi:hypothetical protein
VKFAGNFYLPDSKPRRHPGRGRFTLATAPTFNIWLILVAQHASLSL